MGERTKGELVVSEQGVIRVTNPHNNGTVIAQVRNHGQAANALHLTACWNLIEKFGGDVEAVRQMLVGYEETLR